MKKTLLLLACLGLTGCTALSTLGLISPIVDGVVAWNEGEAHKYYEQPSDVVYRATKRVLQDLELNITHDPGSEQGKYSIKAGDPVHSERFLISIEPIRTHISKLNIRINYLGDQALAEKFYEKVDNEINIIDFDSEGKPVRRHL